MTQTITVDTYDEQETYWEGLAGALLGTPMTNTNAVHVSDRCIYIDGPETIYMHDVWRLNLGATSLDDREIISRHEYRHEAELAAEKLNALRPA